MSQLVIRESSNLDETSDDSELSDWQRDNMDYAKALAESRNKVDERLINLYRIRKANQNGHMLGVDTMKEPLKPYESRHNRVLTKFPTLIKDEDFFIPRSTDNSVMSFTQKFKSFASPR